AIARGSSSAAIRPSRSAAPAKSLFRRSPEPGVVRNAAFVAPQPYWSSENCSDGSSTRGVKLAACRSRQKSLRGFAKWACAAADPRPGLMPQKITESPGAKTSGTALALGGFDGLVGVTGVDPRLELRPQRLARHGRRVRRAPIPLRPNDPHGPLPAAV